MALLAAQDVKLDVGREVQFEAADADGNSVERGGANLVIMFLNTDNTAAKTVTFPNLLRCDQGHLHDVTITVPVAAGADPTDMPGIAFMNQLPSRAEGIAWTYATGDAADLLVAILRT